MYISDFSFSYNMFLYVYACVSNHCNNNYKLFEAKSHF